MFVLIFASKKCSLSFSLSKAATIAFISRPCAITLAFSCKMFYFLIRVIYGRIVWTRDLNFHQRWHWWETCVNRWYIFSLFVTDICMLKGTPFFCEVHYFLKISEMDSWLIQHIYGGVTDHAVGFDFWNKHKLWIDPKVWLVLQETKLLVIRDFFFIDPFAFVSNDS